jgi:hypothetical protein
MQGRIRDIGELYLRILFYTDIFWRANRGYLPIKMGKMASSNWAVCGLLKPAKTRYFDNVLWGLTYIC